MNQGKSEVVKQKVTRVNINILLISEIKWTEWVNLIQMIIDPWVGKIPWRRKWQPTLVFLPGESHGWRNLVGYSPQGRKELDTTERLHLTSPWEKKGGGSTSR